MAALVDTNVVLDMLARREPWYKNASDLLFLCAQGKCHLALSGSTVTDIFYLINSNVYHNIAQSREVIMKLLEFFSVVDVGFNECCIALASNTSDYEDAVLVEAARSAKLDCIITRNKEDFTNADFLIVSPEEYLEQMLANSRT